MEQGKKPNTVTTINNLLKIIESAKESHGGDFEFCVFDMNGEKINPETVDTMFKIRGEK